MTTILVTNLFLCYIMCFEKMKEKMEEIGQTITGFKAKIASWHREIDLRGNRATV